MRLPSSADAARDLLPAARLAAREKYGRVRMMVLSPVLGVLLQIAGELLIKWLTDWLARQEDATPAGALYLLADEWDRDMLPEVSLALYAAPVTPPGRG